MRKPKISIITVCYNSESHVEEAIQSVINQPYENKEYIIIDGCSKDRTMEIVSKYKDKIAYSISEPDKGISDAFNKGILVATGDVIGICNSDDLLAEDILTKVASAWEDNVDVFRFDEKIRDFDTGEEFYLTPTIDFPKIPYNAQPCHMGCFITKKAYEKFGMYDIDFHYCMDVEWLRRISFKGAVQKYVPEICGYFRKGGASSASEKKMRKERKAIVLRYGGSRIDAEIYVLYFILKSFAKSVLNIFGKNFATKLKYRKNA